MEGRELALFGEIGLTRVRWLSYSRDMQSSRLHYTSAVWAVENRGELMRLDGLAPVTFSTALAFQEGAAMVRVKTMKVSLKQVELTYICVALGLLRDMYCREPEFNSAYIDSLIKSLERRRRPTRRVA